MSVMHTEMDKNDELRMEWDPFSDDQVEGLFFPGAGRSELVEQLQHMLRYGAPLTLLVGPVGVGKRSMLNHLLAQVDADLFDVAIIDALPALTITQLLSQLDEPWRSLRPFTADNYLELVPAVAAAADEESKTLLCVIRHAQLLDVDVIAGLQTMLAGCSGLPVKCLLLVDAGELEAVPTVHGMIEALPDSTVMYLDPLTLTQTEEYLQYRMHTAGLGQVSFNESQVQQIFRQGAGNLGQINAAAAELLLDAMPAPKAAVNKAQQLPWMHLGALAVVVVVLAVLFLSRTDEESVPVQTPSSTIVLEGAVQPVAEAPVVEPTPFAEVGRVAAESASQAGVDAPSVSSETAAQIIAQEPVAQAVVAQQSALVAESVVPTTPTADVKPVASPTVEPPAKKPEPVVQQKPAAKPVVTSAAPVDARANWLRSLPSDHYVLQLLGAQEEATVKRFLSQYPSLRKVTYYKTWRQAKPWYVVVQGDYANYDAAKAAINQLPVSLQKQTPWIRKVDVIQQQLGNR